MKPVQIQIISTFGQHGEESYASTLVHYNETNWGTALQETDRFMTREHDGRGSGAVTSA
jgi:hypothetical protein